MSNVVFNESEQIQIQQLTASTSQLEAFKQLILRGNFQGQDSQLVMQAFNFFSDMANQAKGQLQAIETAAKVRAETPKEDSKKEIKKAKV